MSRLTIRLEYLFLFALPELFQASVPFVSYFKRCSDYSLCFGLFEAWPSLSYEGHLLLTSFKMVCVLLLVFGLPKKWPLIFYGLSQIALLAFNHVDARAYMFLQTILAWILACSDDKKNDPNLQKWFFYCLLISIYFFNGLSKINIYYFEFSTPFLNWPVPFVRQFPILNNVFLTFGILLELFLAFGFLSKDSLRLKYILFLGLFLHLFLNLVFPITVYSIIMLFLYDRIFFAAAKRPLFFEKKEHLFAAFYTALVILYICIFKPNHWNWDQVIGRLSTWFVCSYALGLMAGRMIRQAWSVEMMRPLLEWNSKKLIFPIFLILFGMIPYVNTQIGAVYHNFFWMYYSNKHLAGPFNYITLSSNSKELNLKWAQFISRYSQTSPILSVGYPTPKGVLRLADGPWRTTRLVEYLCLKWPLSAQDSLTVNKVSFANKWWRFDQKNFELVSEEKITYRCADHLAKPIVDFVEPQDR